MFKPPFKYSRMLNRKDAVGKKRTALGSHDLPRYLASVIVFKKTNDGHLIWKNGVLVKRSNTSHGNLLSLHLADLSWTVTSFTCASGSALFDNYKLLQSMTSRIQSELG